MKNSGHPLGAAYCKLTGNGGIAAESASRTSLTASSSRRYTSDAQAQHRVASAGELAIAAPVNRGALRVVGVTIHLHDEAHRRRAEVHDVRANDHLPPKLHADPPPAQLLPEQRFRRRRVKPHAVRALLEQDLPREAGGGEQE